ncbi:YrhK family protein [Nocardiopsis chromatogenes]|uniref:YrhK family protein n=1 Tax=Nocardiopsis chromatogenes TaxID=280239 RepID=UPI00034A69E6|nr:YrhK family protein [Nocardiopsis chromatogenes]
MEAPYVAAPSRRPPPRRPGGGEELIIRRRYEAASIANDVLIALWFTAGSIMFFSEAWTALGTWCFLAGSIELLLRPVIRLARMTRLRRLRGPASPPGDTSQDF